MKKIAALTLLIFTVTHISAQVEIGGYYKNYDAFLLQGENEVLLLRNRLRLNISNPVSDHAYGYASFDVKNDQVQGSNFLETNLRELYIDLYYDKFDIRIGKQQIVWGKADGLFITDIINPLDLQEFILPDFEDIRMGITSLKIQFYGNNNRLESMWIPQFVPAKFARPGEKWAFYTPLDEIRELIPDSLITVNSVVLPGRKVKDSEYGFRYSTFVKGIDFTLSYFYTWDDYPVFEQAYQTTQNPILPFSVTVTPEYNRLKVWGGTFSSILGAIVVRGEGAYYLGRKFYAEFTGDSEPVLQRDFLHYMVGGEITPGDMILSGQFIQEKIINYEDLIFQEEIVNQGTILASRTFLNETLKPEVFLIYNFTTEDYLSRILMRYYPADGVEVLLGADFLGGKQNTSLFGQFDKNDNLYLKIKYSF